LLLAVIEQSQESVMITTAQLAWPGPLIVYVNRVFFVINQLRRDAAASKSFQGEVISQTPPTKSVA